MRSVHRAAVEASRAANKTLYVFILGNISDLLLKQNLICHNFQYITAAVQRRDRKRRLRSAAPNVPTISDFHNHVTSAGPTRNVCLHSPRIVLSDSIMRILNICSQQNLLVILFVIIQDQTKISIANKSDSFRCSFPQTQTIKHKTSNHSVLRYNHRPPPLSSEYPSCVAVRRGLVYSLPARDSGHEMAFSRFPH